jgi:hypothetical protein
MGDASIKGRSPLLKGGRVGLRTGGAYGPLRGTTAGGVAKAFRGKEGFKESQALQKKLLGPARATGPIKSKGKVIGTRIAKAGSKKAMGIPRAPMTKSDYALKHDIKRTQKMPDKKFKHVNLETRKHLNPRTGRTQDVRTGETVKGRKGKKNYIRMMKYYHHRSQPKGKK